MKFKLFWKIYLSIAISSVALVWGLSYLSQQVENKMSHLSPMHQAELKAYAAQARELVQNSPEELQAWGQQLQQTENTWLVVVDMQPRWLYGDHIPQPLQEDVVIGRLVEWPIHLNHSQNPVMDLPLNYQNYRLLIQLPQRMRPGEHWQLIHLMITMLLPLLLVAVLSYLIYRHIIQPVQALHRDTEQFHQGDFNTRASAIVTNRKDEIGDLASSFNHMADNIHALIKRQRQLISDISHELRTPLTRLRLLLDSQQNPQQMQERATREVTFMTNLVEDTLTLAWLENEKPKLDTEQVDLVALIESITDDARFEFPQHKLLLSLPEQCQLFDSNHRALGQSIENILRNAMKYSPTGSQVQIQCQQTATTVSISILDQGPGVPEAQLAQIFKPFFRVDKARDRQSGGHGLGLSLAKRQIAAIGGQIRANNRDTGGLQVSIDLPKA